MTCFTTNKISIITKLKLLIFTLLGKLSFIIYFILNFNILSLVFLGITSYLLTTTYI